MLPPDHCDLRQRTTPRDAPTPSSVVAVDRHKTRGKVRTITFEQLAPWRQDNPAILTGYRASVDTWKECFATIWWWHNETVNIWSHLLGALATICLGGYLGYWTWVDDPMFELRRFSRFTLFHDAPASVTWHDKAMFGVFFLGSFVCFICSSVFHTSLCHRGQETVKLMNKVDYLGILALGTLNFFPTFYYGFYCRVRFGYIYMGLMTVSGCVGTYLVCAPKYAQPAYRRMRAVTFVTLGLVAVLPFAHAIVQYGIDEVWRSMSLRWIILEITAYLSGVLLYAERCPECLNPGRFDIIGASHQLFHTCSVIAVLFHYIATVESFQFWHFERAGVCPA